MPGYCAALESPTHPPLRSLVDVRTPQPLTRRQHLAARPLRSPDAEIAVRSAARYDLRHPCRSLQPAPVNHSSTDAPCPLQSTTPPAALQNAGTAKATLQNSGVPFSSNPGVPSAGDPLEHRPAKFKKFLKSQNSLGGPTCNILTKGPATEWGRIKNGTPHFLPCKSVMLRNPAYLSAMSRQSAFRHALN